MEPIFGKNTTTPKPTARCYDSKYFGSHVHLGFFFFFLPGTNVCVLFDRIKIRLVLCRVFVVVVVVLWFHVPLITMNILPEAKAFVHRLIILISHLSFFFLD